jgi:osmotically-inducible protein OsmY
MNPSGLFNYSGFPGYFVVNRDYYNYNDYELSNEEIESIVKNNINSDPFIPKNDKGRLVIKVENGVVELAGIVRCRKTKLLSYIDTFWSDGVKDVINNIKIKQ